jgi:hypothetical protein
VLRRTRRAGRWVREAGAPDSRHRGGLPYDFAPILPRWHGCRPQTVELRYDRGVLTGTYRCACGAVADRTGAWRRRNTRRDHDPAGLCRSRMPQPVRTRVVVGISPHPGAHHHPRFHPLGRA